MSINRDMEKSASEKQVRVHPLAIASICDHYTRVAMGGSLLKTTVRILYLSLSLSLSLSSYLSLFLSLNLSHPH